jgi:hypothetical protein
MILYGNNFTKRISNGIGFEANRRFLLVSLQSRNIPLMTISLSLVAILQIPETLTSEANHLNQL